MSSIPVRVALRCRPFVSQERCDGCQPCLQFIPGEPQVILGSKKSFTFDYTFSEQVGQTDVFDKCVLPMIDNVFKGYNITVMAYGQTGSGKTYTMGTVFSPSTTMDMDKVGIIPRAIKKIFEGVEARDKSEFQMKASFLEVYKEDVIDLLKCSKSGGREEIVIRDDASGVKIVGISELTVTNYSEVLQCLERGSLMRTTGNTAMNSHSSRSHAIFTLQIETKNLKTGDNVLSKFHFVDLAGSERAKKTKAEGERFKEGVNINLGLLALGNVICALCEGDSRNHVPYRESKLTRLLQDSLGGSSHTVMIACVSPADYNMEETLNTLRYAHRARKIKNKPIVNQNPQNMEIARLRSLVQQLQSQLIITNPNGGDPTAVVTGITQEELEAARERILLLENENENLNRELQNAIDQTTELYEKAFVAEMTRDKIKVKLEELKKKTGQAMDSFNHSLEAVENHNLKEHMEQIRELHKTVADLQEVQERVESSQLNGDASHTHNTTFDVGSPALVEGTLNGETDAYRTSRQAEMSRQLQALNKALALKEELAAKLLNNGDQFGSLKEQYEKNMKELEKEVTELQQEKEELSQALRAAQSNSNNKISELRRKRLIELETQLSELKKKMTEYQRLAAMKSISDKEISKLQKDIFDMKHHRVQLVRQMKQESEQMRKYKLDKEREVNHLKQQEQKRRMELVKKQQQFEREQNVSKRRIEQVAAVNKRLKEALLRQKTNGEKRDKDKDKAGAEKVRNLVDQEVELAISVSEAKYHLEMLLKERRQIIEHLEQLRAEANSESSDSSSNESSIMSPSKKLSLVNQLEMELEMKQIQINEIQQKLLDADQEERKKMRWMGIQLMSEAKTGLNYLFNLISVSKQELVATESDKQELSRMEEVNKKHISSLKKELNELKSAHDEEIVQIRKQYEDQIYFLMTTRADQSTTSEAKSSTSGSSSLVTAPEEFHQMETDLFVLPKDKEKREPGLTKRLYKKKLYQLQREVQSEEEITDDELCKKKDPDWKDTPLMRRIRQMRERTYQSTTTLNLSLSDTELDKEQPIRAKKRKSEDKGCGCRSGCNQKRCKCFRGDNKCNENCHCSTLCTNRQSSD